jgi:hypothetical protein
MRGTQPAGEAQRGDEAAVRKILGVLGLTNDRRSASHKRNAADHEEMLLCRSTDSRSEDDHLRAVLDERHAKPNRRAGGRTQRRPQDARLPCSCRTPPHVANACRQATGSRLHGGARHGDELAYPSFLRAVRLLNSGRPLSRWDLSGREPAAERIGSRVFMIPRSMWNHPFATTGEFFPKLSAARTMAAGMREDATERTSGNRFIRSLLLCSL